jgi:hypothetical protein
MYSLNVDPKNPQGNPDPTELRGLGVEMARYTYHDHTPGADLDPGEKQRQVDVVRRYAEAGISSLLILTYDTLPDKPAFDGNWDDYILRFAQRAGQIAAAVSAWQPAFQIWNEPDLAVTDPQYSPGLREEVFGRMLRAARDRIKAVAPTLPVVTAGLASGNPAWLARVIQSQNGELPADVLAIHTYGQRPDPNWPRPDWLFGYVGDLINAYHRTAPNPKIWITEMGVEEASLGGDRNQVAEFLCRFYNTIAYGYSDKVEQCFWFCYSDGMVPTFGLLDANGQQKPAYNAFREAVATRPAPVSAPLPPVASTIENQVADLRDQVADLRGQIRQLTDQHTRLQLQLGRALAGR